MRCVVEAQNRLGEGPIWDFRQQSLYWFDIKDRELWRLDAGGLSHSHTLPGMSSVAALYPDGEDLLIVGEVGLYRFNPSSEQIAVLSPSELENGYRTNDGKVDPAGRLWWSTMDDNSGRRPGCLYRYVQGRSQPVIDGVHIVNSIAFSPAGDRLYLSDSARKTLWTFPLDDAGDPGPREVFAAWPNGAGQGEPDGAATDAEGGLWVAVWGGGRIDHFDPSGRLIESVQMPVSQPTSVAFGGKDLATLYVTSARIGLSEEALHGEPLAGGLFAFEPGVRGSAIPALAG